MFQKSQKFPKILSFLMSRKILMFLKNLMFQSYQSFLMIH